MYALVVVPAVATVAVLGVTTLLYDPPREAATTAAAGQAKPAYYGNLAQQLLRFQDAVQSFQRVNGVLPVFPGGAGDVRDGAESGFAELYFTFDMPSYGALSWKVPEVDEAGGRVRLCARIEKAMPERGFAIAHTQALAELGWAPAEDCPGGAPVAFGVWVPVLPPAPDEPPEASDEGAAEGGGSSSTPSVPAQQTRWAGSSTECNSSTRWTAAVALSVAGSDGGAYTAASAGATLKVTQLVREWNGVRSERSWTTVVNLDGNGNAAYSMQNNVSPSHNQESVLGVRLEVMNVLYYHPQNPAVRWDGVKPLLTVPAPQCHKNQPTL